jgi:hypothetical protein
MRGWGFSKNSRENGHGTTARYPRRRRTNNVCRPQSSRGARTEPDPKPVIPAVMDHKYLDEYCRHMERMFYAINYFVDSLSKKALTNGPSIPAA